MKGDWHGFFCWRISILILFKWPPPYKIHLLVCDVILIRLHCALSECMCVWVKTIEICDFFRHWSKWPHEKKKIVSVVCFWLVFFVNTYLDCMHTCTSKSLSKFHLLCIHWRQFLIGICYRRKKNMLSGWKWLQNFAKSVSFFAEWCIFAVFFPTHVC